MSEWHKEVPKDYEKNLAYRVYLRKMCDSSEAKRAIAMQWCREDFLFFLNAFAWLYEPRLIVETLPSGEVVQRPHTIPFITWEHQDEPFKIIRANLGLKDIGVQKSRTQGFSWALTFFALHDWIFFPESKVALVSSTEKRVDDPEDPDSLFWKLDKSLRMFPNWMVGERDKDWKRNIDRHTLTNLRNGSRITGYACTGDLARGGRAKWFGMDELASWERGPDEDAMRSTQQVTKSRLLISTPEGDNGAYYRAMHEPSSIVKISVSWKDNPTQNRGMYRHVNNKPVAIDPDKNPLPDGYHVNNVDMFLRLRRKGFQLSGEIRSPWYDSECDRANASPQSIARELDMDYGGSKHNFFSPEFFAVAEQHTMNPFCSGTLDYDDEDLTPEFLPSPDGPVKLWMKLDVANRPPPHSFVVGVDISHGTGGSHTSNSAIVAFDTITMDQVLRVVSKTDSPDKWCDLSIAICKWLNDAYLIYEANGPGAAYGKRLITRRYPNIFMRLKESVKVRRRTKAPGWWSSSGTKEIAFNEFHRSVRSEEIRVRDKELIEECRQYVRDRGSIKHSGAESGNSEGEAHGDIVIAGCICLQGIRDRPAANREKEDVAPVGKIPPNCPAARLKEWQDGQKRKDDWDDRSNYDLAGGRSGW